MTTKTQLEEAFATIQTDEPVVILYHSRCPDGIVAMDIVRKHFPNSISLPLNPNNLPRDEEIEGMTVISVDLFQKDENIAYMCKFAKRLYYIDHHPRPKDNHPPFWRLQRGEGDPCENLTLIHTLDHSAAGIVGLLDPHPFVTNLIEPNDLGRFDEVSHNDNMMYDGWYERYWKQGDLTSAVNALKWSMDITHPSLRAGLIREGEELKRERDEYFASCLKTVEVRHIHGHDIAFCRSDKDKGKLANYIREHVDQDIVCVWGWGKDGSFYVSSWRSTATDMNTFLRDLGGGGHANACGLKIPVGEENRLLGEVSEPLSETGAFYTRNSVLVMISLAFGVGVLTGRMTKLN